MLRDFSEESKQTLLGLVDEVENDKFSNFTDWVGDRWYDFEALIGQLDIGKYINNVNEYHKKVIDKNNATAKSINKIFNKVNSVNNTYHNVFNNIDELLEQWNTYIVEMREIVAPTKGNFNTSYMKATLPNVLAGIEKEEIDCLRDNMVKDVGGELIFNEKLLYEYVKKNPADMTDAEQQLIIEVIAQLKDTAALYGTLASFGTDELGVDVLQGAAWVSDSELYAGVTGVSAHYNELYANLLNFMVEISEDTNTFAGCLANISNGSNELSLLGIEGNGRILELFGGSSLVVYAAKYQSEHSEQYFGKVQVGESNRLGSSGKFKTLGDGAEDWLKDQMGKLPNGKDLNKEYVDEEFYFDEDGNDVSEKDAPTFYDKQMTLAEVGHQVSASVSIYEGNFDVGENGNISVTVGQAEAHASVSAGFYVIGADGEKLFSPGVNAEIGASVTAFEAGWEQQWLGDEMLGLNSDVNVTVGKAEAKADVGAQIFSEDGDLDIQLGASASAELIGGEIEGSAGLNVLGGEVGVKGSVNYGIGAHADVGYRDGVFKCDIGASLGVGVSVGFEVDVGGMVNTVVDGAEAAWDGITDFVGGLWKW